MFSDIAQMHWGRDLQNQYMIAGTRAEMCRLCEQREAHDFQEITRAMATHGQHQSAIEQAAKHQSAMATQEHNY